MDVEELQIRMSMNTSEVNTGFGRVTAGLGGMKHELEGAGIHAESVGKSFKKVLHEISDMSPLTGMAIRGALNPMVAILLTTVYVGKQLIDTLKEENKWAEEFGKTLARSYLIAQNAAQKAADAIVKLRETQREWMERIREGKPGEKE